MKPRIRIEGGTMGHDTRVYYIQDDGTEVEISKCVTGLTVKIQVGEPTIATIDTIFVGGDYDAGLEHLAIKTIGPSRIGRIMFRLKARWWKLKYRPRDVTNLRSKKREYV